MSDPTRLDRIAMIREGGRMVRAHPLVGVGPNMVKERYAEYRGPDAVNDINPHLHNVPVQIAAERGLPALAIWLAFILVLVGDLWRLFRDDRDRVLAAAGARGRGVDARRRHVRIQFRRLRVPDAVPGARDAALRRRAHARRDGDTGSRIHDASAARRGSRPRSRAAFPGLRVLVAGDVMLDRFIVGTVTRISPEAPVPVVRFQSEYSRLGGAANVAHNLSVLGGRPSLVGVVGHDDAAARLRQALAAAGVADDGLVEDPSRPTTEKVRIVTERNQQVARVDYEDDRDADADVARRVSERAVALGATAEALLVSDYLKGTITAAVMRSLVAMKASGAPLLVDPKIPHLDAYAGATLVTPNHHEAEAATHRRIRNDDEARVAAREFVGLARVEAALITRGEHGIWLSSREAEGAIPAVAREVSDVTGAGDTVVATLALALAAGATLAEAAVLANHAAGIVVEKFGAATVTPDELLAVLANARAPQNPLDCDRVPRLNGSCFVVAQTARMAHDVEGRRRCRRPPVESGRSTCHRR